MQLVLDIQGRDREEVVLRMLGFDPAAAQRMQRRSHACQRALGFRV